MNALLPLIVALSGLAAQAVVVRIGGNEDARPRGLSLYRTLLALAIVLGAAALHRAGEHRGRVHAVVIALLTAASTLTPSIARAPHRHRPESRR